MGAMYFWVASEAQTRAYRPLAPHLYLVHLHLTQLSPPTHLPPNFIWRGGVRYGARRAHTDTHVPGPLSFSRKASNEVTQNFGKSDRGRGKRTLLIITYDSRIKCARGADRPPQATTPVSVRWLIN